jgi:hypothetical protein
MAEYEAEALLLVKGTVTIEAESEAEAEKKFAKGEWDDCDLEMPYSIEDVDSIDDSTARKRW